MFKHESFSRIESFNARRTFVVLRFHTFFAQVKDIMQKIPNRPKISALVRDRRRPARGRAIF